MSLNCLDGRALIGRRGITRNFLRALLLSFLYSCWLTGCGDTNNATPPPPAPGQLTITTTSLPDGTVNQPYATTLGASGGITPYTWSTTPALPANLTFNPTTGVINGTPAAQGNSTHTFTLVDSSSPVETDQQSLSLTINAATVPPTITTSSLMPGTVNQIYHPTTLQATSGTPPYRWSVNPALPNGMQFNVVSPGTISGTPLAGTNGTTSHTFNVIDSAIPFNQTNNKQLSLTINLTVPPLKITFPTGNSLPNGKVAQPYSQVLLASGGTPPYRWSVSPALPAWLQLDASTGSLTGTPTVTTNFSRTYTVSDSTLPTNRTASRSISLQVTN